jgi:four helix bundle protein
MEVDWPIDYRSNKAWQRCDDLAALVYEITKGFPQEERYGLTGQIRRAAVGAAANIAEGSGRGSAKDYLRFLYIGRGCLKEVEYYIHLAGRLGYLREEDGKRVGEAYGHAGRTLQGLVKHWEEKAEKGK